MCTIPFGNLWAAICSDAIFLSFLVFSADFDIIRCVVTLGTEVFLVCVGNFRCWPKADTSSALSQSHQRRSAGHYKDLTEAGNRARKVSGTQGSAWCPTTSNVLVLR